MRNTFLRLFILLTVLSITGCSSDDGGDDNNGGQSNNCASVTALNITQIGNELNFNISADASLYYEISLVSTANNNSPDSGYKTQSNSPNGKINISNYNEGGYLAYARTVCGNNEYGAWYGPKPLTVSAFCNTPENLNVNSGTFFWTYNSSEQTASNFQVQYGPQGFALGTGTMATVNNDWFQNASLYQGTSYDFYVRAYCTNNIGYGNWAGPYTYYAEENQNVCEAPVNLTTSTDYIDSNTWIAYFNWNTNGEESFEYAMTSHGGTITESDIYTTNSAYATYQITGTADRDFHVRAVCDNGNKSQWTTITVRF